MISVTLHRLAEANNEITRAIAKASHAIQVYLMALGMPKKYAKLYSVCPTGGGEWILQCECDFDMEQCDIIVSEDFDLDFIRAGIRTVYDNVDFEQIGL